MNSWAPRFPKPIFRKRVAPSSAAEVLYLGNMGYGPQGRLTRAEWRALCRDKLTAGAAVWNDWQTELWRTRYQLDRKVSFGYAIQLDGGYRQQFDDPTDHSMSLCFDFVGQLWESDVYVNNYVFAYPAFFDAAVFVGDAEFNHCDFQSDAVFQRAHFTAHCSFLKARFRKVAMFDETRFDRYVRFNEADFLGESIFDGARFSNTAYFIGGSFSQAPSFLGISQQTELIFRNRSLPWDASENAVDRWTALKQLAQTVGQADQVLKFNAHELHARKHSPSESLAFKTVTTLYEWVADYGRSFQRPLLCYALLIVCSLLLVLPRAAKVSEMHSIELGEPLPASVLSRDKCLALSGYRAVFEFVAYRSAGILDFADNDKHTASVNQRLFGQEIEPPIVRIWGMIKAVSSTVLLFLVALGLRNRYRLN